jgi:uncharacterized protein (UPF0303 family)
MAEVIRPIPVPPRDVRPSLAAQWQPTDPAL